MSEALISESAEPKEPLHIALLMYPGVDEYALGTLLGLFGAARRNLPKGALEVYTVARTRGSFQGLGGLVMTPHYGVVSAPPPHLLWVLGGANSVKAGKDPSIKAFVRQYREQHIVASGTGVLLLGECRLLQGQAVAVSAKLEPEVWIYGPSMVHTGTMWLQHNPLRWYAQSEAVLQVCCAVLEHYFGAEVAQSALDRLYQF